MPWPTDRVIQHEHLQPPAEHLGVLVEPAAQQICAWLHVVPGEGSPAGELAGAPVASLRGRLRQRLELLGPLVVTGHQAEFSHAGVLAKTIAACVLAERHTGQAVFLSVDSDLPQATQLALPQITSAGVRRVDVALPGCDPQRPLEHQSPAPREHWFQLFARTASMYELYDRSLLREFAHAWLETPGPDLDFCAAMSNGQLRVLRELGLADVRVLRVSELCGTPEFRAFAAHLILHAGEGAKAYNAAQAAYRERHHVRAAGRPVPPLVTTAGRVEVPLWALRPGGPRRRVYAAEQGDAVQLLADGTAIGRMARGELGQPATHEKPWPIEREGWQLRPRALALSAFARLLLADVFVHGVGGAKYDEVTEDCLRALLGVVPAPLCCVSATLRLPLPHSGVQPADIVAARQRSRDLRFNPQRHVRRVPAGLLRQRTELVRRAAELRADSPGDHESRRLMFHGIRRLSEQILEADPWRAAEYDQRVQMLEQQWRMDQIALDREYFYALHPRAALEELVAKLRTALCGPGDSPG